jgi:cold shock protein
LQKGFAKSKEWYYMAERKKGKVKWFNNSKGYGFLKLEEIPGDIFIHYSDIKGTGYKHLTDGEEVEFSIVQGAKGLQATDLTKGWTS